MRKILFILTILVPISVNSQVQTSLINIKNDTSKTANFSKISDYELNLMLENAKKVENIETKLQKYYLQNKTANTLMLIGAGLSILTIVTSDNSYYGNGPSIPLLIGGGLCSTIGGIISLDSNKHLNFRKKQKKISTTINTQSRYYFE